MISDSEVNYNRRPVWSALFNFERFKTKSTAPSYSCSGIRLEIKAGILFLRLVLLPMQLAVHIIITIDKLNYLKAPQAL